MERIERKREMRSLVTDLTTGIVEGGDMKFKTCPHPVPGSVRNLWSDREFETMVITERAVLDEYVIAAECMSVDLVAQLGGKMQQGRCNLVAVSAVEFVSKQFKSCAFVRRYIPAFLFHLVGTLAT